MADLADNDVFGARGETAFARSADWRAEVDRLLHWHSDNKQQTL